MRRHLTYLLALAFCLRALVPLGFMPALAAPGQFVLVICTASGPATVTLDADGQPTGPKPAHAEHGLCPYSGAGSLAGVFEANTALPIQYSYSAQLASEATTVVSSTRFELPEPARGPPLA